MRLNATAKLAAYNIFDEGQEVIVRTKAMYNNMKVSSKRFFTFGEEGNGDAYLHLSANRRVLTAHVSKARRHEPSLTMAPLAC